MKHQSKRSCYVGGKSYGLTTHVELGRVWAEGPNNSTHEFGEIGSFLTSN